MNLAIFDIDGTLTRTKDVDEQCYARAVCEVAGISGMREDTAHYRHSTDAGIVEEVYEAHVGRPPTADEIARIQTRLVARFEEAAAARPDDFAAVPGAEAAFSQLKADPDWAVAVATGCWRCSALFKLTHVGFDLDGVPVACSDEDHQAREAVLRKAVADACAQQGVDRFARVVYIGDAPWDVRAARTLRIAFLGIASAPARASALRAAGATHILPDYTDLMAFRSALENCSAPLEPQRARRTQREEEG